MLILTQKGCCSGMQILTMCLTLIYCLFATPKKMTLLYDCQLQMV